MSQSKKESPRCLLKREKDDINGAANSPEAKRLETQGSSSNKDDNKKQDDSTVTMPAIEAMMRRMMSTMRQDIISRPQLQASRTTSIRYKMTSRTTQLP